MTNTVIIVNSGSNTGQNFVDDWLSLQVEYGAENWELLRVDSPADFERAFDRVRELVPELVVAGGGDGTVSAVFNALRDLDVNFGVIPLGTSNVFARSLKLPLDAGSAIELIQKAKFRKVSLGKVNDQLFVSLATIGFSVAVSENVSDETKGRFGRLGYVLSGLWHGLRHQSFRASIKTLDDYHVVTTHQLLIANSEIAFPTDITYGVNVFEPKVGIISYADSPAKFSHVAAMLRALLRRKPVDSVFKISTQYAEISASRTRRVAVDGEPFGETPVKISVVKDAVNVIVP